MRNPVTVVLHFRVNEGPAVGLWGSDTFTVTGRTFRSTRMFSLCMARARKALSVDIDTGIECEWHNPENPYRRCDICGGAR
jgi:hypothetical protein